MPYLGQTEAGNLVDRLESAPSDVAHVFRLALWIGGSLAIAHWLMKGRR